MCTNQNQETLHQYIIGGIDEANKGEAIGPLFISICYAKKQIYQGLSYYGDSKNCKKTTLETIDNLLGTLNVYHKTIQVSAEIVDKRNINDLLCEAQCKLLQQTNVSVGLVDCHLRCPLQLTKILEKPNLKVICKHKFDTLDPLVGLASIVAKKRKIQWFASIERQTGAVMGTGNLGDAQTKAYIKKHYPTVPYLRKKWDLKSLQLSQ